MSSHQPSLLIFVLALLFLSGCNEQGQQPEQLSEKGVISVVDSEGNRIELAKPAQRIIALAPHAVENAFSAGAGEQLVGAVAFSNYPEAATKLPIVGGYKNLNIERIIELKPDLILAWGSGNSHNSYQRLKELGFTVYVNEPSDLEDVVKSIRDIGVLSGNQETANQIADEYLTKLNSIKARYQDKQKLTTFYQVWNQPLRTINGKHVISDAMRICGGINIYHDEIPLAPTINIESILEHNPSVIFASGMSDSKPEWLEDWKQWPSLQAVQQDNLFFVPPDHIQRHTVRLLLGIESICQQLDIARQRYQDNDKTQ